MATQLTVEIAVDDKGSVVVKQFGDNVKQSFDQQQQSINTTGDSLDFFKSRFVQMTAAVAVAWLAAEKAINWAAMGASALQAADSFRIMADSANINADQLVAAMHRASGGTIEDSAIMQKAVKGMILDFSADQLVSIMETARVSARVTGQDVQTTFENITDALSTQMPRSLRQYGLVTKDQMMVVQQALSAGITDINLYDFAMANAAVQTAKYGETTQNAAEKVQGFRADMREMAEAFGQIILAYTVGSQAIIDLTNEMASDEGLKNFGQVLERINADLATTSEVSAEAKKQWDVSEATQYSNALTADAKARLGQVEAQKLAIESLKATNKAYFDDEESRIKYNAALYQVYQQSTYAIAMESIAEREALLDEYYDAQVDMFQKEAAARTDMDRQKVSDATIVAEKIKALEADVANKKNDLERQKNLATADYYAKQQQLALTHYEWLQDMTVKNAQNYMDVQDKKFAAQTAAIDDIAQYEMLTGKIVQDDEIDRLKDMIQEYNDTFVGGWRQGLYQMQADWMTTGKAMTAGVTAFSSNASSTLSTVLFDGWKGQLQGFSSYWTTFTDAMLKKFTDMIAQMAVQWMTFQAAEMMGINLPGMGGSGGSVGSSGGSILSGAGLLGKLGLGGGSIDEATSELAAQGVLSDAGSGVALTYGSADYAAAMSDLGLDAGEDALLGAEAASGPVGWAILAATMLDKMTGGKGMAAIMNVGSSIWNGVSDAASSVGDAVSSAWDAVTSIFHGGGIVGTDSAPTRSIPSLAFAGAPRLHQGFAPDEFPAILQKGERVLSRKENASYGGGDININIGGNVIGDARTFNDFTKKIQAALDEHNRRRIGTS